MKQPFCHKVAGLSDAEAAEECIRAVTYGQFCPASLSSNPVDVSARLTALSVTRVQNGPAAAVMSISQPEAKRP